MDPWKRRCQNAAANTSSGLRANWLREVSWSRGESAFVLEAGDFYLGHVEEGLGTKNRVADKLREQMGKSGPSYYDLIAKDSVAAIVNDLSTLGLAPVSVALHIAAGSSDWFADADRAADFVRGFGSACTEAGALWGPGESPTLPEILLPGAVEISGSAIGMARPKSRLIKPNVKHGDTILAISSSGIHANGLTFARRIIEKLPQGYLTTFEPGTNVGQALLRPTHIYSGLVDRLIDQGVQLSYAINVTGHGWRKIMRLKQHFHYVIDSLPPIPHIFSFLQELGPISDREAYANFNMGAGYILIAPVSQVDRILTESANIGFPSFHIGHVENSDTRSVTIGPKQIEFQAEEMSIR
jgi:phosphoribosylformylglycinamidine cyclo-ligase